jgi:hypothetical protein
MSKTTFNPLLNKRFQIQEEQLSPSYSKTAIDFTVDNSGSAVKFFDVATATLVDYYLVNTIEAVQNGTGIKIQTEAGYKVLINKLDLATTYINGVQVTQILATAIQDLNNLFSNTGVSGVPPVITSSTTINMQEGNALNYTLTGTNGVAYSWIGLPPGILTLEGNLKTIVGGSSLAIGIYTFTAVIVNYYGEATKTITLNVHGVFSNTFSVDGSWQINFPNQVVGQENITPLYRPSMTGTSADAWSMLSWFKWRVSNFNIQTLFHFGHPSSNVDGKVYAQVKQNSSNNIQVILFYGSNINYLQQVVDTNIPYTGWHSLLITYTGGDTGNNSADITTYHNQFSIHVDGIQQSTVNTDGNYGFTGSLDGTSNSNSPLVLLKKGYFNSFAPYLYVDEMAFWDSDRSADAVELHNNGTPLDLTSTYSPLYTDYFRFGDGTNDITSFPTMTNLGIGPDLTMLNGTIAKYVNIVP